MKAITAHAVFVFFHQRHFRAQRRRSSGDYQPPGAAADNADVELGLRHRFSSDHESVSCCALARRYIIGDRLVRETRSPTLRGQMFLRRAAAGYQNFHQDLLSRAPEA